MEAAIPNFPLGQGQVPMPPEQEEKEEVGDMNLCLVCCSKVNLEVDNEKGLGKNLRVIFLLRNLLQVPDTQLERNLVEWGNPENWIKLCDACSQLTRQAEDLHCKIVKIERELRNIRKLIVEKARSSVSSPKKSDNEEVGVPAVVNKIDERISIWKSTREFVIKHDYSISIALSNPFIEGDSQAEYLQRLQDYKTSSLSIQVPQDLDPLFGDDNSNCSETGNDEDDHDDWKPDCTKDRQYIRPRRPPKLKSCREIIIVNGQFQCRHCPRLFNTKSGHYAHEVTKHVSKPGQYVCSICGKAWDANKSLMSHRRHAHKLTANGSPVPVTQKTKPKKLRKIENINGKFKCRHCDRLFNTKSAHFHHEVTKHVSNPGQYVCNICGRSYDANKILLAHKRSVHKLSADDSPITLKSKRASLSLKRVYDRKPEQFQNVPKTTSSGKWKCHFCDEEFELNKERNDHEEEKHVSNYGDFQCDICGKSRNSVRKLLQHRRRVHNIGWGGKVFPSDAPRCLPKNPQTCELCGKVYSSKCGLTNHLRLIHERRCKSFCQFCGYNPINEHELMRHMLGKHREEDATKKLEEEGWRIWKCEVVGCKASYLKEKGLERHREKIHGGGDGAGKRFACGFCGKGFWDWYKMNRHEEIHRLGGEKPWKCGRCGGAFSTKQYLRDHERRVHQNCKDDDN